MKSDEIGERREDRKGWRRRRGDVKKEKSKEIEALVRAIGKVADILGIVESGFRCLTNKGHNGGQEVAHLHFHIFGGEKLGRMINK